MEKMLAKVAASWAAMLMELTASSAAALAESLSAAEQSFRELADRAAVLAETTLANERCCWEATECGTTLGEMALAKERCYSLSAAQAAELALATARVAVSADLANLALPELALAEDKRRQEEAAAEQCRADDIAHKAQALPLPTLPHPAAMLSTPRRTMTYVGAVLSMMGGALTRRPPLWHHRLYHHLPSTANFGWYANVPGLVVALVVATVLVRPVLLTRSYPPTLTQCWGDFLRLLRPLPRWHEQPHLDD
jgi:hypothetical protein